MTFMLEALEREQDRRKATTLTKEETVVLMKAVDHTGCNCGEWECFSSEELALLTSSRDKLWAQHNG